MNALIYAYAEFDKLQWVVLAQTPLILADREETEEGEFEDLVHGWREDNNESLAATVAIVEEAMIELAGSAMPWWQRVLMRRAVRAAIARGDLPPPPMGVVSGWQRETPRTPEVQGSDD